MAAPVPAFGPGEQATYTIQYLGVTGGTAQVTVGAPTTRWGQDVWPIVTVAQTAPAVAFFPVRDKFVTYWDPKADRAVGSELVADENHHRRRERIHLEHEQKTAIVTKQKEGGAESESSHEIPVGAQDIAAATFALRNEPLAVGKEFDLPVFTGNRTFMLHAIVEGKQLVRDRDTFRVRVQTRFGGSFASKGDLVAFIGTDPAHLPLRVEAEFALGTLVAELSDYKPGS